jgi:hypothetical protein
MLKLAKYILATKGCVSYFELHKLAYLAEYIHVRKSGRRLTSGYFIRQKDGPYCTDLQIDRLRRADPSIKISTISGKLFLSVGANANMDLFPDRAVLPEDVKQTLDETMTRYAYGTESELKTAVYLTTPMRYMLRREKTMQVNLYNAPIDFLAAS